METEESEIKYAVEQSEELGRFLIASEDISAGTVIIHERPIISGPSDDADTEGVELPSCLGCYKRLSASTMNRCSQCSWPVCGLGCEITEHHAQFECEVFVRNCVKYPCAHTWPVVNKSIFLLRTLLLKQKWPKLWKQVILKLEHHTRIRQTKANCAKEDLMILDNLSDFLGTKRDDYCDKELIRISGVINVNAFNSMKIHSERDTVRVVQCLYPNACLLAHSCIPNASWSIDGKYPFHISICSTVTIKKGDVISISYNIPEMVSGTLHRIVSIDDVAHFNCKCVRCSDPTENGTFVSAIKCFDCETSYVLPVNSTDQNSVWKCYSCDSLQTVQKIVLFLNQIEDAYERIKKRNWPQLVEAKKLNIFIRFYEGLLHKNHYLLQEVRLRIVTLQVNFLGLLSNDEIKLYVEHCKILLAIADVLMPGLIKTRASLKFLLSKGLVLEST